MKRKTATRLVVKNPLAGDDSGQNWSLLTWASEAVVRVLLAAVMIVGLQAPASADVLFTDVSVPAGVSEEQYFSESIHSLGVAWVDFDLDGFPDIFATNGFDTSGPHLYRNLGDGTFERADQYLPPLANLEYVGVRFADYDNDGDPDLYVYTAHEFWTLSGLNNRPDGPANLLLQNQWVENGGALSEPLFVDVAALAGVDDCPAEPLGTDYGCYQTRSAVFLDYDLDGCSDLYVGHLVMNRPREITNRNSLYRNNCDGTFSDVTDSSQIDPDPERWRGTLVVAAGLMNADACPDIYVGNTGNNSTLAEEDYNDVILRNNCDGTFSEVFADQADDTPAAMGIDFADLDLDGLFEVYVTDQMFHGHIEHDPGNTLYRFRQDGSMSENLALPVGVRGLTSWGTNFLDADSDGDEDLFVGVAIKSGYSLLYENRKQEGFVERNTDVGLATGIIRGSALADYDRDGDLDLLVVNQEGPLQLFRNDSDRAGNSLMVRVRQTRSNADGFGVLVRLTAGGKTISRQLKGGTSAHSQDFGELHFAFPTPTADEVFIAWPSGQTLRLMDVAPGVLDVTEP